MRDGDNAAIQLPWPAEWSTPRPKKRTLLGVGYLGVLALGATLLGVSELLSGERDPAAFLISVGIYLGTFTALGLWKLRLRRRMSARSVARLATGSSDDGIAIFYSARLQYLLATIMFTTFILMAAHAIGGILEWEISPIMLSLNAIHIALLGALAVFSLWFLLGILSGRVAGRRPRLVLRPDGVYHRSYTFEHFVPWHTVFEVSAEEFRGPIIVARAFESKDIRTRRTIWAFMQDEPGYVPDLRVRGHLLAVDPAVAYHALRYYHAHPGARAELLTAAGEQRIRSGNVLEQATS